LNFKEIYNEHHEIIEYIVKKLLEKPQTVISLDTLIGNLPEKFYSKNYKLTDEGKNEQFEKTKKYIIDILDERDFTHVFLFKGDLYVTSLKTYADHLDTHYREELNIREDLRKTSEK
jgi:hypothetical protein